VRYGNNFQTFEVRGLQVEAHAVIRTGTIDHELLGGVRRHEDAALNTALQNNVTYGQINGSLVFSGTTETTPSEGYAKATSFWVADRIRVSSLTLLPLLRFESVESRANVDVPTSAQNELTKTTLGFGANYAAGESWTLLAGMHQGFAPPGSSATEGSRGEESTNVEGGVRFRGERLGLDVVGFHTDYSNALRNCLVANPCSNGATDGVQQDGAKRVLGVETSLSALLAQRAGLQFPLHIAYTSTDGEYTRAADVASGVQEGDVLDHTPKHIEGSRTGGPTGRAGIRRVTSAPGSA
jgi:Fe(3+) dicitrate transport protein